MQGIGQYQCSVEINGERDGSQMLVLWDETEPYCKSENLSVKKKNKGRRPRLGATALAQQARLNAEIPRLPLPVRSY